MLKFKYYFISLFLFAISVFYLTSGIMEIRNEKEYKLILGQKVFTELVDTNIISLNVNIPCANTENTILRLGSSYNSLNNIDLNIGNSRCGIYKEVIIPQYNQSEYIELIESSSEVVNIRVNYKIKREITDIRYILLLTTIMTILLQLEIKKINFKVKKIPKKLIYLPLLVASAIINYIFVIPNWDDGWGLAIIRNWDDFEVANHLWGRFNGIFGNLHYMILNQISKYLQEEVVLRTLPSILLIFQTYIVLKILEKYFSYLDNSESRLFIVLTNSSIILTFGSTLRVEPFISLYVSLALLYMFKFRESKKNNHIIISLLFISLSITSGLAGIIALGVLSLIFNRSYIHLFKIRNIQLIFLNSIFFTINILLFNSNWKILLTDLKVTNTYTINSHSYGFFDEWRRYAGTEGIFKLYSFDFQVAALFVLITIALSLYFVLTNKLRNAEIEGLFLIMVLLLSITPSKWGWYVVPLISIMSLSYLDSKSKLPILMYIPHLLILCLVVYSVVGNRFWLPNPSIDNKIINSNLVKESNYIFLVLYFAAAIGFILIFKKKILHSRVHSLNIILLVIIFYRFAGLSNLDNNSQPLMRELSWSSNSIYPCDILRKIHYKTIAAKLDSKNYSVDNGIAYPSISSEVFYKELQRYTVMDIANPISINIEQERQGSLAIGVRGRDLEKIEVIFDYMINGKDNSKKLEINKYISDSSIWQLIVIPTDSPTSIKVFGIENRDSLQITSPFYIKSESLESFITREDKYLYLGPQESILGSCFINPKIKEGLWLKPDLVLGNANTSLNIFGDQNKLRVINTCFTQKDPRFDECIESKN